MLCFAQRDLDLHFFIPANNFQCDLIAWLIFGYGIDVGMRLIDGDIANLRNDIALLQTRKNGVLARERKIAPASETKADRAVADFVQDVLGRIPDFAQTLCNILDALDFLLKPLRQKATLGK